ncbi:hypothetical protein B0H21DRAFT_726896 [Amylocystis lapponica]|nr:hypothetical protein B0H21DRAFT_726896 [Amylocystis lapponica]
MTVCGALALAYSCMVCTAKHSDTILRWSAVREPRTRYQQLLKEYHERSLTKIWMPHLFAWMLLAGFVLLPGTFQTELESRERSVLPSKHLYVGGWAVAGVGLLGLCCCVLAWRDNCIYLLNGVFSPALEHSTAGLLTTITALYVSHKGVFMPASQTTLIVTSTVTVVFLLLTVWCWRVKAKLMEQSRFEDSRY